MSLSVLAQYNFIHTIKKEKKASSLDSKFESKISVTTPRAPEERSHSIKNPKIYHSTRGEVNFFFPLSNIQAFHVGCLTLAKDHSLLNTFIQFLET